MANDKRYGGKEYVPVSIRLAFEEKAYLLDQAGSQSLSGYIRSELLKDIKPRKKQRRKRQKPALHERQMAHIAGLIARTQISNNLNQIARKINSGSLNISDPEERAYFFGTLKMVRKLCKFLFKQLGVDYQEDE